MTTQSDTPPTGVATGVGSMPGSDARAAAEMIAGEVGLVHLPELPARGLGADMIGRSAALLVDMPMDVTASGYRLSSGVSAMSRRARDMLRIDIDALEEIWETRGLSGPDSWVKVSLCGPFTLAASVETAGGHKALHDRGAWSDLVDSIAEGAATHAAEIGRRLGARVLVQFDEPLLDRVIEGSIAPLSRLDVIEAVPSQVVAEHIDKLIDVVGGPVLLHHCGGRFPWSTVAQTKLWGVSLDLAHVRSANLDGLGEFLDGGSVVALGVIPSVDPGRELPPEHVVTSVTEIIDTIGLSHDVFSDQMLMTPACGLAGADTDWAKHALALATTVAHALPQQ